MLKVRDAQMFVFREAAASRFEERMLDYVRETYPARHAELGEAGTRTLVRHGLALGRRHGIGAVGAVSVLIDMMARFGESFEGSGAATWIETMLARHDLPAEVRIESIIHHLNARTGGRVLVRESNVGRQA